MALYLFGDIQACLSELRALLKQVKFNSVKDEIWLTGDIVARGPDSLETLRFVKSLGDSAKMVLGNHDLHLLAIHAGIHKAHPQEHLNEVLAAPDRNELMDWLANQPLLRKLPNEEAYMSHAGISPQWSLDEAIEQARLAEQKLQSEQRNYYLEKMYGEQPNNWKDANSTIDKFRYTINAFTRMRFCHENESLDFSCKLSPKSAPKHLIPWFKLSDTIKDVPWVIGHWAWLMGETGAKNLFALDTGCVYGRHLTALRWHDKQLFIEQAYKPKK